MWNCPLKWLQNNTSILNIRKEDLHKSSFFLSYRRYGKETQRPTLILSAHDLPAGNGPVHFVPHYKHIGVQDSCRPTKLGERALEGIRNGAALRHSHKLLYTLHTVSRDRDRPPVRHATRRLLSRLAPPYCAAVPDSLFGLCRRHTLFQLFLHTSERFRIQLDGFTAVRREDDCGGACVHPLPVPLSRCRLLLCDADAAHTAPLADPS